MISLAEAEKGHTTWRPESEYSTFNETQDSWGLSGGCFTLPIFRGHFVLEDIYEQVLYFHH